MDSSFFSIFLLLVLPPVVGLLLLWYRWLKPKYAAMRMEAIDQQVNRLVVSRALKLLACKPTWETEGDEMVAMYTYQSGHRSAGKGGAGAVSLQPVQLVDGAGAHHLYHR